MIVYAVTSRSSFESVAGFRDRMLALVTLDAVPMMVVGLGQRAVATDEGAALTASFGSSCRLIETSAQSCANVDEAFAGAVTYRRAASHWTQWVSCAPDEVRVVLADPMLISITAVLAAFVSAVEVRAHAKPGALAVGHAGHLAEGSSACLKMLGLSAAMSAVALIVVSVPIAFLALLVWVTSRFPKTTVPMPPGRSKIWGSLPALMGPTDPANPLFDASFSHWHRKLGKLVCYDVTLPAATRMLLVSDLDLIKQVIADDPPKADYNINVFLGQGLVSACGDVWRHDRRLLNPAFNKRFLRDLVFPGVVKHATTMSSQLEQVEAYTKTDINDYFRRMTLDIISEATMGRDYGLQKTPDHPLLVLMMDVFEELSLREINPLRGYHPWHSFMLKRNLQAFEKHCTDLVLEERANLARKQKQGDAAAEHKYERGILSVMLGEDENGSSMPLSRIVDNIKTFLFAGHDTTSTLLSFAVGMIATHKHVETKLLAEIDSVLGDRSAPTHDDLSRLVYLKMVLKETLRMFPPAATGRRLPMGYRLGNYVVDYPKTDIIISSYVVHHDPELWEDPETFDPERFREENSKGRHPLSFIPFLAGNRNCIGQHLALMEATVALAMIYKKFTFRMAYGHVPQLTYRITNVCANGMKVFVFKRSQPSVAGLGT